MEQGEVRVACACGCDSWIVPAGYHGGMDCKACGVRNWTQPRPTGAGEER